MNSTQFRLYSSADEECVPRAPGALPRAMPFSSLSELARCMALPLSKTPMSAETAFPPLPATAQNAEANDGSPFAFARHYDHNLYIQNALGLLTHQQHQVHIEAVQILQPGCFNRLYCTVAIKE